MQYMETEISEIVELVWSIGLGQEEPSLGQPADCYPLSAELTIEGAWSGRFTLLGDEDFVALAARQLFGDDDSIGSPEMTEALCEVANMLAGNVKALLPGPSSLGLPSVAGAAPLSSDVAVTTLAFESPAGCFAVSLESTGS